MAKKGFASIMSSIQQEINVNTNKTVNKPVNTDTIKTNNLRFGLEKKNKIKETEILSVKLNESVKIAFENESKATNRTNSAIATEILRDIFDENTQSFTIEIPKNEVAEKKATTLNLPKDIKEALIKGAKAHNMKTYEYFNKLMEELLK